MTEMCRYIPEAVQPNPRWSDSVRQLGAISDGFTEASEAHAVRLLLHQALTQAGHVDQEQPLVEPQFRHL